MSLERIDRSSAYASRLRAVRVSGATGRFFDRREDNRADAALGQRLSCVSTGKTERGGGAGGGEEEEGGSKEREKKARWQESNEEGHRKTATKAPSRPKLKKRTCFVIMPFGKKRAQVGDKKAGGKKVGGKDASALWEPFGLKKGSVNINFDDVYEKVIRAALRDIDGYEIEIVRCDEIKYSGWIHEKMIDQIAKADIAIVDLTTLNPNVFYELGVRHALNDSVTVLIQQEGVKQQIPFNLGGMTIVKYDAADLRAACDEIHQTVTESLLRRNHVDSLVFRTLPELKVSVYRPRTVAQTRLIHFP